MPTMKIGENLKTMKEDGKPYNTVGIAKTEAGYEIRLLRVLGMNVETRKVLKVDKDRASILSEFMIAVSKYVVNFNQKEME
jgi:hypothetical protein